jgi:8-oxo-dGTP diphosphatase
MARKWIHKVGLAAISNGCLLVARKRNSDIFILPGGKPEGSESDLETLAREIDEELGCGIASPCLRDVFKDVAAGESDSVVVVRLYSATLVGEPKPCSEIEELAWIDIKAPHGLRLAPSIENGILPYLRKRGRLTGAASGHGGDKMVQGLLELV